MRSLPPLSRAVFLSLLGSTLPAVAQLAPGPNPVTGTVGAQTLSSGTGTVNVGGAITIPSGGTNALTMTGTSTLFNNGTIQTLGSGRAIDSNSGIANLTLTNTGLISAVSSDAFRVNTNSAVSLTNSGTIRVTAGGQAIDWAAISSASNTLNNLATGIITAVGEDAVRPGNNGVINNAGLISATPTGGASPSGSDGIDLRTEKNVTVNNSGTISGRAGIATDGANAGPSSLLLDNTGTVAGVNGSGINVDGVATNVVVTITNGTTGVIKGGVLAASTAGDGDGIDVDGILTLNNAGQVLGLGAKGQGSDGLSNNAEAISIGGGSITNTAMGQIIGSSLLADAPNGDSSRAGNGILVDNSSGGNAIAATTITNSGLIQGKSGFGIAIVGTFADTIINQAGGVIRGTGSSATLQTGGGNDVVTHSGLLQHDTGGTALALQAGNDTFNVTGGAAAILGAIDGGTGANTMNVLPGLGQSFSLSGEIRNFDSVNVGPGTFNLTDSASVDAAIDVKTGGVLSGTGSAQRSITVQNGGTLAAQSGPTILDIGGDLNLRAGSAFNFQLGLLPNSLGLVAVTGFLNFTGPGTVLFNLIDGGLIPGTYTLVTFAGSSGLTLANLEIGMLPSGASAALSLTGNAISVTISAVPEPSTYAFGAVALLVGLVALKRRTSAARANVSAE